MLNLPLSLFKLSVVVAAIGLAFRFWLSRLSNEPMPYGSGTLRNLNVFPRDGLAASYLPNTEDYSRIAFSHTDDGSQPDTTAIILNWSRFPNVLLISSLLCSTQLSTLIKEVFIWNNSPHKIIHDEIVQKTGCPTTKLRIHNSPENLYFQARFMACAQANSRFCFIQDDDYLVRPEIIFALHSQLSGSPRPHTIHLLPPHEYLPSVLHEIHLSDLKPSIHTSFAWLGHGTFLHQLRATEFLALLRYLNISKDEMKMADNYYSILSNEVPEIWLDPGIELGGGQPFTVGIEGQERNQQHILQATRYLEQLIGEASTGSGAAQGKPPFISFHNDVERLSSTANAACRDSSCLLETNIQLLPNTINHIPRKASDMLDIMNANLIAMGHDRIQHYHLYSLSNAVDGDPTTLFRSAEDARAGEYLSLKHFDIPATLGVNAIELVLLVDAATEQIIHSSTVSSSSDNQSWCMISSPARCSTVPAQSSSQQLQECSIQLWSSQDRDVAECPAGHIFRLTLQTELSAKWAVYEIWVRTSKGG